MTRIAVVIPTRNRGAQVAEAAKAILSDGTDLELIVVDQSTDGATESAIRPLEGDRRLRLLRSSLRGISNARNTGVAATSAPIIAFTDDDCRPEPQWASKVLNVFQDEQVAIVCGRVSLPFSASSNDYGASFEPRQRVLQGGVPLPDVGLGIGANFGIRRHVVEQLGGFDPLLGAGAPFFRAGEEMDLIIRALHSGHKVINATECSVLHLGVRTGADVRPLAVGYQLSTGAAMGKHARLAGLAGVRDMARWIGFYSGEAIRNAFQTRRLRPGVLCYFIVGAALTFRYRLDRTHQVFQLRSPAG